MAFEIGMMIVKGVWFAGMGSYCLFERDHYKRIEKLLWMIAGCIVIFR